MARLCGSLLAVAIAFGVAVSPANAHTEVLQATIATPSQALPGPNDPGRCLAVAFALFDERDGATSWSLSYYDAYYTRTFTKRIEPPFDDTYSDYPAVFKARHGKHQVALASYSTGQGCGAAVSGVTARFERARVSVEVGQAAIRGSVIDVNGGPVVERVTLTATGRRTLHATTGPDGSYEIKVPLKALGAYTVTPSARELDFLPRTRRVIVRKASVAPAHFRARGGCRTRARTAGVRPKDGLYADYHGTGIATSIQLNYSCHTHEVLARFFPRVTQDCPTIHIGLTQEVPQYSQRMYVYSDGSFSQSDKPAASVGQRWLGQFIDSEHARVSLVMPACAYSARSDSLTLQSEGPFVF